MKKKHTEAKYLTSSDYLGEGWIINAPAHHVIINGTNIRKYKGGSSSANSGKSGGSCSYKEPSYVIKKGASERVFSGYFFWGGGKTEAVFKAFQKKYPATGTNNKPDGKCGPASRKKLKSLIS